MKVIVIASGKGGTGKTSLAAGACAALAKLGRRVLLMDGDSGLRNLDLVLGMSDRMVFSFEDVARGMVSLGKAAQEHPTCAGLFLLTAPNGFNTLRAEEMEQIVHKATAHGFDYFVIDGPAGLSQDLRLFAHVATQAIVVSTPEGVSLRGAEKMARLLEEEHIMRIRLVVNRVRTQLIRHGLAMNIDDAMDSVGLPLLGIVPEDEDVIACGNSGKLIIDCSHHGAATAYRNIARRIEGERLPIMRL